jgi:hypothetical protein
MGRRQRLMKNQGHIITSIFLLAIAGYAIYFASGWSFKTGFFPLAIAIPLAILALAHLLLVLFDAPEQVGGVAVEAEFSNDASPEIARRRATSVFGWIGAFIVLVYLVGFPVAVPLFMLFYLKLQSAVDWFRSLLLTVITWGFFYLVFQRLIHLPFESGLLQSSLGL